MTNEPKPVLNPGPPAVQPIIPPPIVDETVTASVYGRIVDETGTPVKNVSVSCGTNNINSDINGNFEFNNIQLSKYFGTVKVDKTGYINVTRTFVTNTSGTSFVNFQLIPRVKKGSFSATAGGDIVIDNSTVSFQANTLVNASSGAAYSVL